MSCCFIAVLESGVSALESGVSAQAVCPLKRKMFLTHAFFIETMCDLFISIFSGYPGSSLDIFRLSMGYL